MTDSMLGEGRYPAFNFGDPPGPILRGKILAEKKITDFYEGQPVVWPDGTSKYVYILTVDTHDDSQGEHGVVSVWCRGNAIKAIREAGKNGGVKSLLGADITMQHHALGERKGGRKAARLFKVKLVPGELPVAASVLSDSFVDDSEEPF